VRGNVRSRQCAVSSDAVFVQGRCGGGGHCAGIGHGGVEVVDGCLAFLAEFGGEGGGEGRGFEVEEYL